MSDSHSLRFRNEPLTDFNRAPVRQAMERALALVRSELGKTYPLVIQGKRLRARRSFQSINPSRPSEIVGVVYQANRALADRALQAAAGAFPSWSQTPVRKRAECLRQMTVLLRRRKFEFCAWQIFEVGKSWAEADADVAEAIDFMEYYAELALRPVPILTRVPGEKNDYCYLPLGPVLVIPPWNFPLAILVGMTSAALVTGNTVVLKPSSQSPVIAAKFIELALEAGLPPGALHFLTGAGSAIGDSLVKDSRTRMIAFTGSKTVGLHINHLAADEAPAQPWIKRVIAEMGGKNAIIVDETADLDQAAQGAYASAFGFQGQKCSACSRLYLHLAVYDEFLDRLLEKVKNTAQGPSEVFRNFMGPVISADALKKINGYIALGKREGRLLTHSPRVLRSSPGFFIPPTIFDRLSGASRLWTEEIFGPVLSIAKVRSFDEALRLANRSEYGLTGAVFSRDPDHLKKARAFFFCGNLYLNRKCTGALVGGHPFGGFNLSGTDSKAGGPDYLGLFTQAQCVSEKW